MDEAAYKGKEKSYQIKEHSRKEKDIVQQVVSEALSS
jgi:hypothetical protein